MSRRPFTPVRVVRYREDPAAVRRLSPRPLAVAVLACFVGAQMQAAIAQTVLPSPGPNRYEPLIPQGNPGGDSATLSNRNSNLPDRPYSLLADILKQQTLPDDGRIQLAVLKDNLPADGQTPMRMTIRLFDGKGAPLSKPTRVTVEASGGRVQIPGRATSEEGADRADIDRLEPGTQMVVDKGVAEFYLLAPASPGDVTVRVSSGPTEVVGKVTFLPDLRPMIAAGIIEGVINVRRFDLRQLTPARTSDLFEEELRRFQRRFNDGKGDAALRASMFVKGTISGQYLLTLAYDSDRDVRAKLFRDISPEEFYPVLGDDSTRGIEAQTTSRFYVRVDKNKSYVLFGDFSPPSAGGEARQLGAYSRTLTGVQGHHETGALRLNAFAAYDRTRQVIDEQAGRGISGPYVVSSPFGLTNTEKVEILVRDRNQPAVILKSTSLTRFADYDFDPFSGRLIFKQPIPSVDENLNPIYIRITYEVDQGGERFWVAGIDGQYRLGNRLEVGGSYVEDRNPGAEYKLGSANLTVKLGEKSYAVVEVARSDKQGVGSGNAARAEIRHSDGKLDARAFIARTDTTFENPASAISKGRGEAGLRATYSLNKATQLTGEVLHSEDRTNGGRRSGAQLSVGYEFNSFLKLDVGLRTARETAQPAGAFSPNAITPTTQTGTGFGLLNNNGTSSTGTTTPAFTTPINAQGSTQNAQPLETTSLRLRLTARLNDKTSVYVEGEQDLDERDKHAAALGAEYQFAERGRLYLRHEFAKSLSGLYGLNAAQSSHATVAGISTNVVKDTELFSEYRMRDAVSGRDANAAIGLRNLWNLSETVKVTTSAERVHTISGSNQNAKAITGGIEYTPTPLLKTSARLEWRGDQGADNWLSTAGLALKVDRDYTLLVKNYYSLQERKGDGAGDLTQERLMLGLAYRPVDHNRWDAIGRLEYRYEDDTALANPIRRRAAIAALAASYHPSRPWTVTSRYAFKHVRERTPESSTSYNAHLIGGRIGYDLTERWDLGAQANMLWSPGGSTRQYAVGFEAGYLMMENLWLSLGYNFTGFEDKDLTASEYTNRGAYLRLRYKFDEDLFASKNSRVNKTLTPGASGK
jgi:hypothetical protein